MTDCLVPSVAEAAKARGVSADLLYELAGRGDMPCRRFGRRKVIPRRAIELPVESAVADFNGAAVLFGLNGPGSSSLDEGRQAPPAPCRLRTT